MEPFYLFAAISAALIVLYVAWQSGQLSKLTARFQRKSTVQPPLASENWPDTLKPSTEPALYEKVLRERTHGLCSDAFILRAMREGWSPGEAMSQLLKERETPEDAAAEKTEATS